MSQQDHLNNFLNSLAEDISGFIGASVVDLGTGMSLASVARVANFDLDVAAAYNCEMVKAKRKTIQTYLLSNTLPDMERSCPNTALTPIRSKAVNKTENFLIN